MRFHYVLCFIVSMKSLLEHSCNLLQAYTDESESMLCMCTLDWHI